MNARDLEALRSGAVAAFREVPIGTRLPGMKRPLTQEDARLIAIYESALQVLNRAGALRDGWLEANQIKLIEDDSLPEEDDYS